MQTMKPGRLTATRTLIATACTGLVLLAGCGGKPEQTAVKPPPPDVRVAEVIEQKVPIVMTFSGTVKSIKSVDIVPRVSGFIDKRLFEEGTYVEQGAHLYLIDPRPFKAVLDAAQAQLQRDQAGVVRWTAEAERYTRLAKTGAGSVEDKERAIARLAETKATVASDQANVETAKLNLAYTDIRAPFAGRIENTLVYEGDVVTQQRDVLTTLVQLDPIHVVFNVSRRRTFEAQRLNREGLGFGTWKDSKVEVKLSDGSLYPPQPGKLDFISVQIDPTTDTLEYRAVLPNPVAKTAEIALIPGQYVPVRLTVGEDPNTLLVPGPALVQSQVGTQVYVVNKDNKVESRKVEVGQAYQQQWIIKKGLKQGERVIVEGVQKVRPDVVVNIKEKDSTEKKQG